MVSFSKLAAWKFAKIAQRRMPSLRGSCFIGSFRELPSATANQLEPVLLKSDLQVHHHLQPDQLRRRREISRNQNRIPNHNGYQVRARRGYFAKSRTAAATPANSAAAPPPPAGQSKP
jgi:hypothetical protein